VRKFSPDIDEFEISAKGIMYSLLCPQKSCGFCSAYSFPQLHGEYKNFTVLVVVEYFIPFHGSKL
jgi:hypothetical protein